VSFPMSQIAERFVDGCLQAVDHEPGTAGGSYIAPVIAEGNNVQDLRLYPKECH
jgi:hypothetical protein